MADISLKFVSAGRAQKVADKQCLQKPAMSHYWEKAVSYVCSKNEAAIMGDAFGDEFKAWETFYFKDLASPVKVAMNMLMPYDQRMIAWVWMTE